MKRRNNILAYLLLNIIVSAATTLGVLYAWDRYLKAELNRAVGGALDPTAVASALTGAPGLPPADSQAASTPPAAGQATTNSQPVVNQPAAKSPAETPTLPPADLPLIQFFSVVGAGDLEQEVVLLRRLGEGNLRMVGWQLVGEDGIVYVFPEQPELILYKDGAVQVHTKSGEDTATDVYWNRSEPAWRSGEIVKLLDSQGIERASYRVP